MVLAHYKYGTTGPAQADIVAERPVPRRGRALPESILHTAWRRAGRTGLILKSGEGRSYRVIYPGRPAGGQGPDFVDAIIETEDGARLCGDIEIHVRSSDWRSHGHASDRRYNGVLFHVAATDSGAAAFTRSGRLIPLLVMGRGSVAVSTGAEFDGQVPVLPGLPVPFLSLGAAGDERFANRSDGYAHEINVLGADQAIYEGLMDCMGFPRNRAGFRRLARRLPWSELSSVGAIGVSKREGLEESLLWAAGFGPRPSNAPALSGRVPEWVRQAGRPDNQPQRRVRGIAGVLSQITNNGVLAETCATVVLESDATNLSRHFAVPAETGRALVGPARAAEIVVNAVLPFVHALASLRGDRGLAGQSLKLYREYPTLSSNALVAEAARVVASVIEVPTKPGAREQQGLIHIYRMMTSRIIRSRQLPLV